MENLKIVNYLKHMELSKAKHEYKVSIVVPNYNGAPYLQRFFESIEANTIYSNYFVVLIDNGSTDNSIEVAKNFKNRIPLFIIKNSINKGFPKACNQGIRFSLEMGADYIVIANNDVIILTKDWIRKLLEPVAKSPLKNKVGIIGCRVINLKPYYIIPPSPMPGPSTLALIYERFVSINKYLSDKIISCGRVPGPFFVISKRAIESVGFMDEAFTPGYEEEVDYFIRVLKSGFYIIYNPNVTVAHLGSVTFSRYYRALRNYFIWRNRLYLARKHYGHGTLFMESVLSLITSIFTTKDSAKVATLRNISIRINAEDISLFFLALFHSFNLRPMECALYKTDSFM